MPGVFYGTAPARIPCRGGVSRSVFSFVLCPRAPSLRQVRYQFPDVPFQRRCDPTLSCAPAPAQDDSPVSSLESGQLSGSAEAVQTDPEITIAMIRAGI